MRLNIPFRPKLLETLKGYRSRDFLPDLIAGVTVGIVALPLAMAFAIASGVKPEAGIFTAVIAGLIISALGGSKVPSDPNHEEKQRLELARQQLTSALQKVRDALNPPTRNNRILPQAGQPTIVGNGDVKKTDLPAGSKPPARP
jgi:hypothetical protein